MTAKADGVFLWVHFALNSLLKGMRNEDDFQMLIMRLEELPSGMEQLYLQMWRRLNGDEQRYHQEASMYFSYHDFFPLSIFDMMIALQDDVREKYLRNLKPQSPTAVVRACEKFKTRILTRCAGLLEVGIDMNKESPYTSELETTSSEESSQSICPRSQTKKSLKERYHKVKVRFLHRTARDFLLNTQSGHAIAGETSQSHDERFANVRKAYMVDWIQGFRRFHASNVYDIITDFGIRDRTYEIDLLQQLQRVCKALSVPGLLNHDITRLYFWRSHGGRSQDMATMAATAGCVKYVQHFVSHENIYVSPYYRDLLFQHALCPKVVFGLQIPPRNLQLARWLAQNRADRSTSHDYFMGGPFQRLLQEIILCYPGLRTSHLSQQATEIAQLIEEYAPVALKPKYSLIRDHRIYNFVCMEIEADCLYHLAMSRLRQLGAIIGNSRYAYSKKFSIQSLCGGKQCLALHKAIKCQNLP